MLNPGHPSTAPENGTGDARAGTPPLPTIGTARGPSRKRGGTRTAWNGPTSNLPGDLAKGACQMATGGGRRDHCGCASTQAHKQHTSRTEGATGPSSPNAQTTWNGVPAGEDKGDTDRATRYKHREKREAGQRGRGGATRSGTSPALPTCRERRAHTNRALQPPRQ